MIAKKNENRPHHPRHRRLPQRKLVPLAQRTITKPIKYYEIDRPLVENPFNWEKIRKSAEHFLIFHSEDDPFICVENGEKIAKELGAELQRSKNAGHFNANSGYTTFELLLEKLKPIL